MSLQDAPVIGGARAGQPVRGDGTVAPFATLTVTDLDRSGATASVTIPGGAAVGSFTAGSSSGWALSVAGNGDATYVRTFAAQSNIGAAVEAALRTLVLQPAARTDGSDAFTTAVFTVKVADPADGNAGTTNNQTTVVIQDTTAPAAPVTLALAAASDGDTRGDGLTNDALPSVEGTAEPGSTIALRDGSTLLGTATTDNAGRWTFVPSSALAEGGHNLTATATDAAGNVSAASAALALTVDTVAPTVTAALARDGGTNDGGVTNDPALTGLPPRRFGRAQ